MNKCLNQAAKVCPRVLLYWQIMTLCWVLFAVVGNILPCYKNYLLYVRINSLMSLSLFTKETTDVEMWLRFTLTRGLCNWRSKFRSIRNANVHKLHVNRNTSSTDYNYSVNLPSLRSHINYLDMLQCPDLEAGALLPNWWTSYLIDAESYFRVPCQWQCR